ncbi:MAG: ribonuclease [Proteobacteria bacterium HN_bin10]|nr:MAG: ribonuclease [Proteobacteria bacterium HN_bin10]
MVIDSSAIVAILFSEVEAQRFAELIEADGEARLSAANFLEISNVVESRHGLSGRLILDGAIAHFRAAGLLVVAFDEIQAELAREGFRRYGKGRHPAGLNFGDCFAYALAKALDAPLLYKGTDFGKTDIRIG